MLDAVWINTLKLWSISALFCITILVKYFLHSAVSVIVPVIYSFALHIKTSNHVPLNWMTRVSVYKNIFVPSYIYRFQWSNNCRVICVVHSHNLPHFSFGPPPQLHLHRVKMIHQSKNKNEWAACTFVVTVWRHYEHIVAQMWDSPVVELNPKISLVSSCFFKMWRWQLVFTAQASKCQAVASHTLVELNELPKCQDENLHNTNLLKCSQQAQFKR